MLRTEYGRRCQEDNVDVHFTNFVDPIESDELVFVVDLNLPAVTRLQILERRFEAIGECVRDCNQLHIRISFQRLSCRSGTAAAAPNAHGENAVTPVAVTVLSVGFAVPGNVCQMVPTPV